MTGWGTAGITIEQRPRNRSDGWPCVTTADARAHRSLAERRHSPDRRPTCPAHRPARAVCNFRGMRLDLIIGSDRLGIGRTAGDAVRESLAQGDEEDRGQEKA